MNIPEYRTLSSSAVRRLQNAPAAGRIVLLYSLIIIGAALVSTTAQYVLDLRIAATGGLSKMGLRTLLSSLSQLMPLIQYVLTMVMGFGYLAAMVRVARGQFVSPKTLRAGADRFWPLLRLTLLKMAILTAVSFGALYLSMALFLLSPFSDTLVNLLMPLIQDGSVLSPATVTLDGVSASELYAAMAPAFVILGVVMLALVVPVYFRYRMSDYVLYDHPGIRAINALRESRRMMRGNCLALLKLDLHMWWYYLLTVVIVVVAYGDMLLSTLGVTLPISGTVAFFLFYVISLGIQLASFYFLRNRVETVYALAYDSLCPRQESGGVVLGNIFQM